MINPRDVQSIVGYGKFMTLTTIALRMGIRKRTAGIYEKTIQTFTVDLKGKISGTDFSYEFGNSVFAWVGTTKLTVPLPTTFPQATTIIPPLSNSKIYAGNLSKGTKIYVVVAPAPLIGVIPKRVEEFEKEFTLNDGVNDAYFKIEVVDSNWSEISKNTYSYSVKARVSVINLINVPENTAIVSHLNLSKFSNKITSCKSNLTVNIGGGQNSLELPGKVTEITAKSLSTIDLTQVDVEIEFSDVYTPNKALSKTPFSSALYPLKVKEGDEATVKVLNYTCNPNNPNRTVVDYLVTLSELVPGSVTTTRPPEPTPGEPTYQ